MLGRAFTPNALGMFPLCPELLTGLVFLSGDTSFEEVSIRFYLTLLFAPAVCGRRLRPGFLISIFGEMIPMADC